MKIWEKIFSYSIVLFIILFNGAGVFIIENIYNRNLNSTIVTAINEEKNIRNSIYLNSDLFEKYSSDNLWSVIKSYIYGDISEVENIEIFNEENKLIGSIENFKVDGPRKEILDATIDESKFIIREINGKKLLFVSTMFKINDSAYKLVMTKDITFLTKEKDSNYELFLTLSLFVTICLAVGMYIIAKSITKPIENLIDVSNSITNGDYKRRADYTKKNDEVGVLSNNFNIMMQEIEDKIYELEEMNEQKQRFIDNLTHEMKTPITSIIGYSDLLLKGNINDDIRRKSLDYIYSQGKRLENLNSSLIKLIMIRNLDVERQNINLSSVIEETYKGLKYKIDIKDIDVEINLVDENILGDRQLVILLLTNILDNALKASEDSSKIVIEGEKIKANRYALKIIDFGFGISEEELKKVKEPFYMIDKSRAITRKNFGLGLAICQEICEANKIQFNIESEEGKGTNVTLIFEMENLKYE